MVHKLVVFGLTGLVIAGSLLCLIGAVNLLFRRPFLDRWPRNLLLLGYTLLGSCLFDLMPVRWRLPAAIGGSALLLALMLWLMRRPGRGHRPSDPEAGESAV
jgi:hypothetical protein